MTQQEYNIKIAEYILAKCKGEDGEHLRFQQLLFNLGITEWSEEAKRRMTFPIGTSTEFTFKDKYNEKSENTYEKLGAISNKQQVDLFNKMVSSSKINVVTCGNCGVVLLHEVEATQIFCGYCEANMDLSDCPDLIN